jgi:hypothetical protein
VLIEAKRLVTRLLFFDLENKLKTKKKKEKQQGRNNRSIAINHLYVVNWRDAKIRGNTTINCNQRAVVDAIRYARHDFLKIVAAAVVKL